MIVFLVGLGVGLAVGFVLGAVWEGIMDARHTAELHDRWSHHGYRGPYDDEEEQ